MYLSMQMQTVNVIPWGQARTQKTVAEMESITNNLRSEKGFIKDHLAFLYKDVYGNSVDRSLTSMDLLTTGEFSIYVRGTRLLKLKLERAVRGDVHRAYVDMQHKIAYWAYSMQHFFDVRFPCDAHGMIEIMGQCLDLRMLAMRT